MRTQREVDLALVVRAFRALDQVRILHFLEDFAERAGADLQAILQLLLCHVPEGVQRHENSLLPGFSAHLIKQEAAASLQPNRQNMLLPWIHAACPP
ncbi:hypothetical protein SDC9_116875 [bioreactor metagenome]|uniref:Uncharacterized protein n=1 Tax=bioreactor metagenome TaxID=1076179 RepID=A0A645BXM0_9ZZZZ